MTPLQRVFLEQNTTTNANAMAKLLSTYCLVPEKGGTFIGKRLKPWLSPSYGEMMGEEEKEWRRGLGVDGVADGVAALMEEHDI